MKIKTQLHCLEIDDYGVRCLTCGQKWSNAPSQCCPGVRIYRWEPWPEPLVTKSQLSKAGYKPGPVRAVIPYDKSSTGDGWLYLFSPDEGSRRKPPSVRQLAARAKMEAANTCPKCGMRSSKKYLWRHGGLCEECAFEEIIAEDRQAAIEWARTFLVNGGVILDTETTGLEGAEIIEIAIIDTDGNVLVNSKVKALHPEYSLASGAVHIHGIRPEDLADVPTFGDLYPQIWQAIHQKHLVVYNLSFDLGILRSDRLAWYCPAFKLKDKDCAMLWYAQYCGQWHHYWKSYTWQPLPGGDHSALGDAQATLDVIKHMAS